MLQNFSRPFSASWVEDGNVDGDTEKFMGTQTRSGDGEWWLAGSRGCQEHPEALCLMGWHLQNTDALAQCSTMSLAESSIVPP